MGTHSSFVDSLCYFSENVDSECLIEIDSFSVHHNENIGVTFNEKSKKKKKCRSSLLMMLARASASVANLLWTPISWSIGRIKSRFHVIFGLFHQDYIFTMKWDECHCCYRGGWGGGFLEGGRRAIRRANLCLSAVSPHRPPSFLRTSHSSSGS